MRGGTWDLDNLGMFLIALVILFILIATIIIFKEKGIDLIGKMREILLFR